MDAHRNIAVNSVKQTHYLVGLSATARLRSVAGPSDPLRTCETRALELFLRLRI